MNPYTLLGGLLLWLASLAGVGYWQNGAGVNAQAAADQVQFDRINAQIAVQKDQANVMYRAKQQEVIAVLQDRDRFKNQLESERETNRAAVDDLRQRYAGLSLRYRAAQGAGPGAGGGSAGSAPGNPAGADAAPVVQLPDPIAADLRALTFDADRLAGEYATCYAFAQGPVK